MDKRYKVIWIDDEYDKQDVFIDLCRECGIDITPFKVAVEGLNVLERDVSKWDAVILDAKVYCDSEEEVASLAGLRKCYDVINRLSVQKKKEIPFFISTGQPDLCSDENFRAMFGDYYIKERDDDQLIADIKRRADEQFETQIHHKFREAFELCKEKHQELMHIAKIIESENYNDTSFFNDLRKILTWLLVKYCPAHGLGRSYNEEESMSLSKAKGLISTLKHTGIIPDYIIYTIESCEFVAQNGSHSKEEGENKGSKNALIVDEHTRDSINRHIIPAAFYELLSIISWCKLLPDDEVGISALSEKITLMQQLRQEMITYQIEDVVQRDEKGNFYCVNCKLPYTYCNQYHMEGKKVGIKNTQPNTEPLTCNLYPLFASPRDIEVIE